MFNIVQYFGAEKGNMCSIFQTDPRTITELQCCWVPNGTSTRLHLFPIAFFTSANVYGSQWKIWVTV